MATARQQVAAAIAAATGFTVSDYPREPAQLRGAKPFVDVFATDLAPVQEDTKLEHRLEIHVYASRTAGPDAEDELEDNRDAVLLALQRIPGLGWDRAERVIFMDGAAIGYKITATAISDNEYRKTILSEGTTP